MKKTVIFGMLFLLFAGSASAAHSQGNLFLGVSTGIDYPARLSTPFTVGYFLSDNLSLGLEYGHNSNANITDSQLFGSLNPIDLFSDVFSQIFEGTFFGSIFNASTGPVVRTTGEYTNEGVYFRWYPSTSFESLNIILGYNDRTFNARVTGTDNGTEEYQADMKISSSTVTLGIGNHMVFSTGMYLGVDWVLKRYVLSSSLEITNSTGSNISDWETRTTAWGTTLNKGGLDGYGIFVLTFGFAF